ncbi:hypothetical protein BH23DEI1_BH23DEI1_17390 [soil metagenome]
MNESRRERDDQVALNDPRTHPDTPVDPHAGAPGQVPHEPPVADDDDVRRAAPEKATKRRSGDDPEPPELRPAVLGRLEGLGIITRVRDASGALADADGSWRPADETATLDELRETFPEGSVTTFAGSMVEANQNEVVEDVSMQVVIKRHGEYEDNDGRAVRLVNFAPRDVAE